MHWPKCSFKFFHNTLSEKKWTNFCQPNKSTILQFKKRLTNFQKNRSIRRHVIYCVIVYHFIDSFSLMLSWFFPSKFQKRDYSISSCSVAKSNTLCPHELQNTRFPLHSPRDSSDSWPLSRWCHPTISSCCSLLLLPSIFHRISLFQWVSNSHQVAKVLELLHQSLQWMFRVYFLLGTDWFDQLAVQRTLKSLF